MKTKKAYVCLRCSFVAGNSQALSRHENQCTLLKGALRGYVQVIDDFETKRKDRDDDLEPILKKIPRVNQGDVGEDRIGEIVSQVLEPSSSVTPRAIYPTRSGRIRHQPRWFQDMVPSLHSPLPHMPAPPPPVIENDFPSPSPPLSPLIYSTHVTQPNEFGLYRSYTEPITTDPERAQTASDLCDVEFEQYIHSDVPGFKLEELQGFNAIREAALPFGGSDKEKSLVFMREPGWHEGSVTLKLPAESISGKGPESQAKTITVGGIYHRKLTDVIESAFSDLSARKFHYTPFRLFYKKDDTSSPERVYTELYNSDAMLEEHEKLQREPREAGCELERSIAALMVSSDSTHLANFGSASLWPIYCYFGNQSKYTRSKPSSHAAHHVAYIPSLPDTVSEEYIKAFERAPSSAVLTHLKRELMQAIWKLILDDEFIQAYKHGIIVKCGDGVERRLYPRIMTYSADYPEKVLLSTLRYLSRCPCIRCFVEKKDISAMGTDADMTNRRENIREDNEGRRKRIEDARKKIFTHGRHVNGKAVETLLKARSEVPTRNTFSERLSSFGFQFHRIFVPDLLHEFELGVWKAVFTHLLRLLTSLGRGHTDLVDERYRIVPRFGRDTIRRFRSNVSAMKQLAARDFEDLLQCSIPVFEGLLPGACGELVLDLLFVLCSWHALAKLRLHTTSTIELLQQVTRALGHYLREFVRTVCSTYEARELDREVQARNRRMAKDVAGGNQTGSAQVRKLNLFTFKLHSLGDYPANIELFGTSDGYSTQTSELEHRQAKRNYDLTNKRVNFPAQIARHQQRDRLILKIKEHKDGQKTSLAIPFEDSEPLPQTSPNVHYQMSNETRFYIDIHDWLEENKGDQALEFFYTRLQNHLLSRMDTDFSLGKHYDAAARNALVIKNDRLYQHKYLRINFTTYDARRAQDSINPCSHADIMTLAENSDSDEAGTHPYCYARVLGIFHAEVFHRKPGGQLHEGKYIPINFLWVRWYSYETDAPVCFPSRRLYRLSFRHYDSSTEFGFLDPDHVLRAIHVIPALDLGMIDHIGKTVAREPTGEKEDWTFYYVNIFADRDSFMRFVGGGIGHKSTGVERTTHFDLVDENSDEELEMSVADSDEGLSEDDITEEEGDEALERGPEDGEDGEDGVDFTSPEIAGYGSYD